MVSTKQNPNPQQTKPIPMASKPRPTVSKPMDSKPTTNQQRANDEKNTCKRRANRKPPTQIATTETQDQDTETQIANRKSKTQLPPKLASHHHWNPNRKFATHWSKSQPIGQNLNPLHPNHKTHHWSTTPPIHCQKIERESPRKNKEERRVREEGNWFFGLWADDGCSWV